MERLEDRTVPTVVANADAYVLLASAPYTSNVSVLANDSNDLNLPMTAQLVQGPTHAAIVWRSDGTFDLTPDGYKGYDQIIYTAFAGEEYATTEVNVLYTGVKTWTGNGDGVSWNDSQNWLGNVLPGLYDDVTINAPGIDILIPEACNVTIRSLQCNANLEVQGLLTLTAGDSEISGAFDLTGALQIDGKPLTLKGGGSFDGALYVAEQSDLILKGGEFVATQIAAPQPPAFHLRALTIDNGTTFRVFAGVVIGVDRLQLRTGGFVTGTGDVDVYQQLNWTGGRMTGTGTTRNFGTMTVDTNDGLVQTARTLENHGVNNWIGSVGTEDSAGPWRLETDAFIDNRGVFNINAANGRLARMYGTGTLSNSGTLNQLASEATSFDSLDFINEQDGILTVQAGVMTFRNVDGTVNGMMRSLNDSQIIFSGTSIFTLDPLVQNPPTELLAGEGTFVVDGVMTRIVVPAARSVVASNLILKRGTVEVSGTLRTYDFNWQNGTILTPEEAAAAGIIEVADGDHLRIEGVTFFEAGGDVQDLVKAQIKVLSGGSMTWDEQATKNIEVSDGGSILLDGGTFAFGPDLSIRNAGNAGPITLRNGGSLTVNYTVHEEGPQCVIELPMRYSQMLWIAE